MKNYQKIFTLNHLWIIFSFVIFSSHAQQRAQYSQYALNQFILNPAVAGTQDYVDIKAGYRSQWVGLEDAPATLYLSAQMPIGKEFGNSHNHHRGEHKAWHGIGTYLYNDVTGPTSRSGFYGAYSFNIPLSKKVRMSTGIYVGAQSYKVDGTELALGDPNDPLFSSVYRKSVADAIAGIWIYSKNYFFGVASHQLLGNKLDFEGLSDDIAGLSQLNRHYFATAGMNLQAAQDLFIVPSIMVKSVTPAPVSVDLTVMIRYQYKYWVGASARAGDSFSLVAGTLIKENYSISYSYDLNYSSLRSSNTGSHEILLGVRLPPHPDLNCPSKFWSH